MNVLTPLPLLYRLVGNYECFVQHNEFPAIIATAKKEKEILKELLSYGANPNLVRHTTHTHTHTY